MAKKTYWCDFDCRDAVTVEGFCVGNIYAPASTRYYNLDTGERGRVERGSDGELHFVPHPGGGRCHGHAGWRS